MNSIDPTSRETLDAFVDGELGLEAQLAFESRLESDPGLRSELERLRALRAAIRETAGYHLAPAALRRRLTSAGTVPPPKRPAPAPRNGWAWRPFASGVALAGLVAAVVLSRLPDRRGDAEDGLTRDVVASHVRATLSGRMVDVASSDRHVVKPWLSSRLDFSPPVGDAPVAAAEFVGGRVDYLAGHPVAVLVYRLRQHLIDVYVWPEAAPDHSAGDVSERGFHTLHWARDGMRWWVVSDLNRDELATFVQALALGAPR